MATIAQVSVASTIRIGVGYPLAGLLTEVSCVRAAYGLGLLVTALAFLAALRSIPFPPEGRSARVDVPGALLLAGGLFLVLLLASETNLWNRHLRLANMHPRRNRRPVHLVSAPQHLPNRDCPED